MLLGVLERLCQAASEGSTCDCAVLKPPVLCRSAALAPRALGGMVWEAAGNANVGGDSAAVPLLDGVATSYGVASYHAATAT